jgi:hypothetical protein
MPARTCSSRSPGTQTSPGREVVFEKLLAYACAYAGYSKIRIRPVWESVKASAQTRLLKTSSHGMRARASFSFHPRSFNGGCDPNKRYPAGGVTVASPLSAGGRSLSVVA